MKIQRILFPTDFSVYSEKAREYTLYLGEKLKASIYIIHAIEPLEYPEIDEEIKKFYKELEKQMEKKIEDERETFEKKGVQAKTNIIIGPRWRVINTFAKEKDIDLIVMGSHGLKTETGQMAIGTTSHKVAFSSPCPVLLVRYDEWAKK
ncbi:MAG TPA: universal stress protein [Thermodesulfobacteriota bacterium]|nr:universal stress protein [Thermodesulfobacteriota bacterium]